MIREKKNGAHPQPDGHRLVRYQLINRLASERFRRDRNRIGLHIERYDEEPFSGDIYLRRLVALRRNKSTGEYVHFERQYRADRLRQNHDANFVERVRGTHRANRRDVVYDRLFLTDVLRARAARLHGGGNSDQVLRVRVLVPFAKNGTFRFYRFDFNRR